MNYSILTDPTIVTKVDFNITFNRFYISNSTNVSQRVECRKTCHFQFHFYTKPQRNPHLPYCWAITKTGIVLSTQAPEPPILFLLCQPLSWCIFFFIYLFLYLFLLCVCPLPCYYTVRVTKQPSRSMPVFNIDMSRSGCAGRIHSAKCQ